jgi:arylsulfatase A-like enzyme
VFAGTRPNIVLILADDLGYRDISCYGSERIQTPHIDSIAAKGVRFTDGYATAGTCSPSRAALMTGLYQQRFGFEFNTRGPTLITGEVNLRGLDPEALTVADVLQNAGYATGIIGKWHLGFLNQFHPTSRGFDEFFGILNGASSYFHSPLRKRSPVYRGTKQIVEEEYLTDALAREAVSFIDRHHKHAFFLYVPFNAVHDPLEAPAKLKEQFAEAESEEWQAYLAMTSALDDAVGAILAALAKHDLEEETLVIFLSDNGAAKYLKIGDNSPFRLGKLYLFEGGIRVPFMMKWPGNIPAGTVNSLPVSSLDLAPTIAASAGVKDWKDMRTDGVNLTPWLTGEKDNPPHQHLFWRNGPNRAVRRGQWKMIQVGSHVWLFNLRTDPGEITNLSSKHPGIVQELRDAFEQWQQQMKAPAWPSRSNLKIKHIIIDGVRYEIHV